jgi:uncharacterized protein YgbK (DUF1537 family)
VASIEPSVGARTFIIADDLTGACDAAVAFSSRGFETQVLLDEASSERVPAEVCAISTETRHAPLEYAVRMIGRVAQRKDLQRYDRIFKKIDSVFRGNTFHEIHAFVGAFPNHFAIISPAYPALGRISSKGLLTVRDMTGETSIPVRQSLAAAGLHPHWIAASQNADAIERQMLQSLREGNRCVFCDAVTEEDLQSIVHAAQAIPQAILWIGSAGLAHALAMNLPLRRRPERRPHSGTVLLFVGSNHAVTERQLTVLHERDVSFHWRAGWDGGRPADDGSVAVVHIDRGQTTEDEVRAAVAHCKPGTIACLFMTGGDTAMLVCRALGIEALSLDDEFEAGLPQGIAVGGRFAGCTVILKSGGFGATDVLRRIAHQFGQKKEVSLCSNAFPM